MRPIQEAEVEKYLMKMCKACGIKVRKVIWPGRRGAPDRVLFIKGGVYVETKRPDRSYKVSYHQQKEHREMREGGMIVYCAYTKDEVDDLLKEVLDDV
jgi:hypothetical protein